MYTNIPYAANLLFEVSLWKSVACCRTDETGLEGFSVDTIHFRMSASLSIEFSNYVLKSFHQSIFTVILS